MKSLFFILITFFAIAFIACEKEEPENAGLLPIPCFRVYSCTDSVYLEPYLRKPIEVIPGQILQFQNCSENTDSNSCYSWDFGDGNASTFENSRHFYKYPGIYDLVFEVTNDAGTSKISNKIKVLRSVTGFWQGNLKYVRDFGILLDITQKGKRLEGTFQFSDGSGFSTFDSTSCIKGDSLYINFFEESYDIPFNLTGVINDSCYLIKGIYRAEVFEGVIVYPWEALRIFPVLENPLENKSIEINVGLKNTEVNIFIKYVQK